MTYAVVDTLLITYNFPCLRLQRIISHLCNQFVNVSSGCFRYWITIVQRHDRVQDFKRFSIGVPLGLGCPRSGQRRTDFKFDHGIRGNFAYWFRIGAWKFSVTSQSRDFQVLMSKFKLEKGTMFERLVMWTGPNSEQGVGQWQPA